MTFANYSDALAWMKSNKLRAIALTSTHRFPQSPDLPTMAESGLPGYEVDGWSGLLAPAGTPPAVIARIYDALRPALKSADMKARMEAIGAIPGGNTPAEFGKMIDADMRKWSDFVKRTGIQVSQ
jgi:tripartite-type tricarboxylate transporter receptor subunit TctC